MNLRFVVLVVFSLLLFVNCENEQIDPTKEKSSQTESEINLAMVNWEHIEYGNKTIFKFVNSTFDTDTKLKTTDGGLQFSIDRNRVQVIERKNYTTYTFVAYTGQYIPRVLNNYVIREHKSGKLKHYLLTYNYEFNQEGEKVYNKTQLGINRIKNPEEAVNRTSGCFPELVKVGDELICNWRCSGDGNHTLGDDDCSCETSSNCIKKSTMECYTQAVYDWNDCTGGGGGDSGSGDTGGSDPVDGTDPNTGGGSGGGTDTSGDSTDTDDRDDNSTSTIPLEESMINSINNCINDGIRLLQNRTSSTTTTIPSNYIKSLNLSYAQLKELQKFLVIENGCSEGAQEFAILALSAWEDENFVDFAYEYVFEINETTEFQNETCLKSIKDEIVKQKSLSKIIKKFEPTYPVLNLEWDIFSNSNWRNTGKTSLNQEISTAFISINKESLTKVSNVVIVKTIAHELIHAELYRKLKEIVEDTQILSLSEFEALENNFFGIADYVFRYGQISTTTNAFGQVIEWGLTPDYSEAHHNQMADFYRNTLIEAMKLYDQNNNMNRTDPDFYEALSWAGLTGTDSWDKFVQKIDSQESHIPIGQRTYNQYQNIMTNEYNNTGISCN